MWLLWSKYCKFFVTAYFVYRLPQTFNRDSKLFVNQKQYNIKVCTRVLLKKFTFFLENQKTEKIVFIGKAKTLTVILAKKMQRSCQKGKTSSFCVGGFHYSSTVNIDGDLTKTDWIILRGKSVICNRKNQWVRLKITLLRLKV